MSDPTQAGTGPARALAGWGVLLVLVGYAGFLHHGLGPLPDGPIEAWSPREFLIQQSWIEPFEMRPWLGVAAFALPAALLAAAVFWLTRSAVARTLAVAAVICSMLFPFYGLRPPGPGIWSFFGWRGSAVMVGLALALAATITSPLLARSWLRLPVAGRVAVYLPIFVGIVAMLRNVTGTDPTLRFAISPWPVVPLFGLDVGSVAVLGVLAGMACAALSLGGERPASPARRWGGCVAAVLLPGLWFKAWHGSFPLAGVLGMCVVGAVFVLAAVLGARGDALRTRGRHLAWGFVLACLPLAVGEAWARHDYTSTREGSARVVIDALAGYYEKHEEYPENLSQLVEEGHLDAIPTPNIGFSFLGDGQEFAYQSFGNGYNLEFSSPDWVQCAYNPAWSEEEDWDDEDWDDAEEQEAAGSDPVESLGEAWSCPSSPPELW